MTRRPRSAEAMVPGLFRPSAEDEANLRAAIAELDGGGGVELTAEELHHWAET
jgi:hypothetical protein